MLWKAAAGIFVAVGDGVKVTVGEGVIVEVGSKVGVGWITGVVLPSLVTSGVGEEASAVAVTVLTNVSGVKNWISGRVSAKKMLGLMTRSTN